MAGSRSEEQRQFRSAAATLVAGMVGLATAVLSGVALVPRVRLVDVVTVVVSGIGAGAALVWALVQFRLARSAAAAARQRTRLPPPPDLTHNPVSRDTSEVMMKQQEVAELMLDIERSVQMRNSLYDRLKRQEAVDLVEEWKAIEQIDLEVANKIRKRPVE